MPNLPPARGVTSIGRIYKRVHTDKVGTWSQTGTTVTITITSHGYAVGESIAFYPTAGTGTLADTGVYVIQTSPDANTVTITSTTSATGTGTMLGTATQTLYTLSLPPLGAMDELKVHAGWLCTNNANVKTSNFKINNVSFGGSMTITSSTGGQHMRQLVCNNTQTTQTGMAVSSNTYAGTVPVDYTFDFSTASTLIVTMTKATGTDSVSLGYLNVELSRGV